MLYTVKGAPFLVGNSEFLRRNLYCFSTSSIRKTLAIAGFSSAAMKFTNLSSRNLICIYPLYHTKRKTPHALMKCLSGGRECTKWELGLGFNVCYNLNERPPALIATSRWCFNGAGWNASLSAPEHRRSELPGYLPPGIRACTF